MSAELFVLRSQIEAIRKRMVDIQCYYTVDRSRWPEYVCDEFEDLKLREAEAHHDLEALGEYY